MRGLFSTPITPLPGSFFHADPHCRELIVAFTGKDPTQLTQTLTRASAGAVLDVTRHTASNYAELKANLAKTYLAKWMRKDRPRWVENWIDKATGQHL